MKTESPRSTHRKSFLNKQFEDQKARTEKLLSRDTAREKELNNLNAKVRDLEHQLQQESISRNRSAQYHRSSLNVIVGGIPQQDGEELKTDTSNPATEKVIHELARAASFTNFSTNDIDVCHRVPSRKSSVIPTIVVRFRNKNARMNFYKQRKNLRDI